MKLALPLFMFLQLIHCGCDDAGRATHRGLDAGDPLDGLPEAGADSAVPGDLAFVADLLVATPDAERKNDLASASCSGCGQNQVCLSGMCVDVPKQCPCPVESYCDLATNRCVAGCTMDGECTAARYCDTVARTCLDGCRNSDGDCPPQQICDNHVCHVGCRSCVSDGNPCTMPVCQAGVCIQQPLADGAPCPDDGNGCTTDLCAAGSCIHQVLPDQTSCAGASDHELICLGGTCHDRKYYCVADNNGGFFLEGITPSGMIVNIAHDLVCGCSSSTMFAQDAVQLADPSCTLCLAQDSRNQVSCW